MDKPKVNLKAWEPIEKRKNKGGTRNGGQSDKRKDLDKGFELSKRIDSLLQKKRDNQDEDREIVVTNWNSEEKYIYNSYDNSNQREPIYPNKTSKNYNIEIESRPHRNYKRKKRRNIKLGISPQLVRMVTASIGAIGMGMIFGYLLLHYFVQPIFTQNHLATDQGKSPVIQNGAVPANSEVVPEQIFYLLQAGVFSEQTGAQKVLLEQKNIGEAAVVNGTGPYHVYIGFSTSKEKGLKMREKLKSEGKDLYLKEYTIQEYRGNMSSETFRLFSEWATTGNNLSKELSNEAIDGILALNNGIDYDSIQKLHQQFLIETQNIKAALGKENLVSEQNLVQGMTDQINYAIAAINAYKKNANNQYLWTIQESIIQYKFKYEELTEI